MYKKDGSHDRFRIDTGESLIIKLAPYLLHGDQEGCMKTTVAKQLLIYVKYVSTQLTLQIFAVCEASVFNLVFKRISSVTVYMF